MFSLPSSAKTKMFDYMKDLDWLLYRTIFRFLRNNQVDVDVRVNEISIRGSPDSALDTHQTMLLSPLKNRLAIQVFTVSRVIDIGANPAYILASSEAPFPKAKASHVESVAATAPEKHEASIGRHFADVQFHYLQDTCVCNATP